MVRLVDDDPAQRALGLGQNRGIFGPHEHVFQHRGVGDQDRRGIGPQGPAVEHFAGPRGFSLRWRLAIVQAVADASAEWFCPGGQAITLAFNEGIEGVQEECPDACDPTPAACPVRWQGRAKWGRENTRFCQSQYHWSR